MLKRSTYSAPMLVIAGGRLVVSSRVPVSPCGDHRVPAGGTGR